jgi:hypothetical protein
MTPLQPLRPNPPSRASLQIFKRDTPQFPTDWTDAHSNSGPMLGPILKMMMKRDPCPWKFSNGKLKCGLLRDC